MARVAQPEMWARVRAELGAVPAVAVVPSDNILIGYKSIMAYLRVNDKRVLERWVDEFALPIIFRPDGQVMSSITSIDQWILLAAKLSYETKLRAGNTTPQKRARRVQSWREDGRPPTISALYRYGAPTEVDEFRPGAVHRSTSRMGRALPDPGGSDSPSGDGPSEVHSRTPVDLEDGGVQRKNRDEC